MFNFIRKYLLFIFLIILIIFRFIDTRPVYKEGQQIRITGKVTSEPIKYEKVQQVKLLDIKAYIPLYPEVKYGDEVVIEGIVKQGNLEDAVLIDLVQTKGVLYKTRNRLVSFYHKSLPEPHSSLVAGVTIGSKQSIPKFFWEDLKTTGQLML